VFVARALKAMKSNAASIARTFKGAGYTIQETALALRLSDHARADVEKALPSAGFPKKDVEGAIHYAGFK
jgi:hypothetical protein